jgi:two-component system OmpR family response regulator
VSHDNTAAPLGVVLFVAEGHTDHVAALRLAGYHVEVSPSALSALQRGQSLRPDALIVPLTLPDMDGSDVAHRIGAAARAHALAVVILASPDDAQASGGAAVTAGATFCNLPCSPADLVATVGKQLAARRLLRGQSPS